MRNDAKHYYAILGVAPTSSDEEIRAAFRRRAKELHPDAETGSVTDFILLKKAYDVVSDPAKRIQYDRASRPRRRRRVEFVPVPPRRLRIGGMSLARFAAAFLFMGGLSFGALEVILQQADVPLSSILDLGGLFSPPPAPQPQRKQFSLDQTPAAAAETQAPETQAEYQDRKRRVELEQQGTLP